MHFLGALEWTRTTTPFPAQALNLLRIPFRHEGISLAFSADNITPTPAFCQRLLEEGVRFIFLRRPLA